MPEEHGERTVAAPAYFQKVLKIRHLRVVSALAELGLVGAVAERLHVTQPAVSKQIAEIERTLGVPIVTRRRNRLFLTPIGERLAYHARQVLHQIDRAEFDIEAMRKGLSGAVRVGSVSSLAPLLLPDALALFKQSAPQATVSVVEGHVNALMPDLRSGAIDVLIGRVWQVQPVAGIAQEVLMREPVSVVAGRDHPLAGRLAMTWSQAIGWPWILPPAGSVARRAIEGFLADAGLALPANLIESLSLPLNIELLRTMPALAFLPQRLALAHARRGDLVVLPLTMEAVLSEGRCFWRDGAAESNGTLDLFLRCLRQVTAGQA